MDSKMDMSHYSREKLQEEIIRRDEMIANLKQEIQRFRQLFHARKIAVSAETATKSPHKIIHKDQKTRDIIESAFLVNEFLCQLEESQIDEIIQSMYPLEAAPESTIIRQGEHGSQLFVLEEGRVQVSKDAQFLRIMEAPCVFGELAILYHCERTATVKALTPCRVWAIERKIFHSINVNAAKSKHNSIFSALKRCRHFTNFSDNSLHLMSDLTTVEEWKHKTEVTSNQLVGRIFLIARGNVIVRRASQFGSPSELQQLQPGDIFGETYRIREMIQALSGLPVTASTTQPSSSPHRHSCLR
jgi:cGMP-dependent protein kinase